MDILAGLAGGVIILIIRTKISNWLERRKNNEVSGNRR